MASFELYDIPQVSSIGMLHGVMRYWYKNDDHVGGPGCLKVVLC